MAKFCTKCGSALEDGVRFCTACGSKIIEKDPVPVAEDPVPVLEEPTPIEEPKAEPVVPAVQEEQRPAKEDKKKEMAVKEPDGKKQQITSVWGFFGLLFLFALPIAGIIACLIMCFAAKKQSTKNFARAMMVWYIIGAVVLGVCVACVVLLSGTIIGVVRSVISESGDLDSWLESWLDEYNGSYNVFPSDESKWGEASRDYGGFDISGDDYYFNIGF